MILPPWAYAAGAVITVTVSFGAGWRVRAWRCEAQVTRIESQIAAARDHQREHFDKGAVVVEQARVIGDQIAYFSRTIIERQYRNVPVPANCAAPGPVVDGLRAQLDAANRAATGEPAPAVQPAS